MLHQCLTFFSSSFTVVSSCFKFDEEVKIFVSSAKILNDSLLEEFGISLM